MCSLVKKILTVPLLVVSLLLIPVGDFQQIITMEPAATASGSDKNPQEAIDSLPPSPAEENKQSDQANNAGEQPLSPGTVEENGKIAYLTFDDGPSPQITPKILEVLKQHDLKATFFLIGEMAEQYPELVRQIQKEGHLICNHTYSHKYKAIYACPDSFMAEITKAEEVLETILEEELKTNILRFPGGSFGKKLLPFRERVIAEGYQNIDWNVLNGDAEALHVPVDKLISRLKETLKNRDNAVILMHDSNTKKTTAEALPEIIDYLQTEGYSFKTLENYDFQNTKI